MYRVADRARPGALEVVVMVQKSNAAGQQKDADEKCGGYPPLSRRLQIEATPETQPDPIPSKCSLHWIPEVACIFHGFAQPGGYARLIVQRSDRCQAGRTRGFCAAAEATGNAASQASFVACVASPRENRELVCPYLSRRSCRYAPVLLHNRRPNFRRQLALLNQLPGQPASTHISQFVASRFLKQ